MTSDDIFVHQDQKVLVENSNTYTMNTIGRDAAGKYKCSLVADEKMEASRDIVVSCKFVLSWPENSFLAETQPGAFIGSQRCPGRRVALMKFSFKSLLSDEDGAFVARRGRLA